MIKNNIYKIFYSIDNKHQVEIKIIDDVSWFNINKLENESYKTFLLLVKNIIEYLSQNNVKYIKQYVYSNDLINFKKSSHIELNDELYIISTNIIDFFSELIDALGIQKI